MPIFFRVVQVTGQLESFGEVPLRRFLPFLFTNLVS